MNFLNFFKKDERRVLISEIIEALEEASGETFSFVRGNFDNEKENVFISESGKRFLIEETFEDSFARTFSASEI